MLKRHNRSVTEFLYLLLLVSAIAACATNQNCEPENHLTGKNPSASNEEIYDQGKYLRKDRIFRKPQLTTPLLFAHRGGVLEAPESTKCAFKYALEVAKADVLELDVQLTKDGRFVVWHGPELRNVSFDEIPPDLQKQSSGKKNIWDFEWSDLKGNAWVEHPDPKNPHRVKCSKEETRLLLLSDFLQEFPNAPLNIEMKSSFKKQISNNNGLEDNIREFLRIIEQDQGHRTIVVASAQHRIIKEFRRQNRERYPTNLSWFEQLWLGYSNKCLNNRVLETTYDPNYASRKIIERVRRLGGSTYVFSTKFGPIRAIDNDPTLDPHKIYEILERGVDGIMTDRPAAMREIIDAWIQSQLQPQ